MKTYCIFLEMSTGYVAGATPRFSEYHKKPIEACGSDAYMLLDNRNSIDTMYFKCLNELKNRRTCFIGFKIVRCDSLIDEHYLVAKYIYPNIIK